MFKIHSTVKKYKLSKYFEVLLGYIGLTVINLIFFVLTPVF